MQRSLLRAFFAVFVGVLVSGGALASSGIDCRSPSLSRNEIAICRDASLSSAYQAMRQAYAVVLPAASSIDPGVSARQDQWERAMLTQCADAACLQSNLANRTVQLQQALVKVNGIRQSRGEPPVSPPNPYAQPQQTARLSAPPPVDRNPYVNEAPATAPAAEPSPPRELAVAPRSPTPVPAQVSSPAPAERQVPPAVAAQATPPQSAEAVSEGASAPAGKELDAAQVKAIVDAQRELLAKMAANDEKIAALEAEKAAVMAGQATPSPASSGGVTVEPPPSGEVFTPIKKNQWWTDTKPMVERVWVWFLVINLGVFLYLNFKTDLRIFTNLTDMKACLFVGVAFLIDRFTKTEASPIVGYLIVVLVFGALAFHTFKATESPVVAFFLVFAKYALVNLSMVFVAFLVLGFVAAVLLVTDRKQSLITRLLALLGGYKVAKYGTGTIGSYAGAFCQDPVNVSLADYFKGVTSRKNNGVHPPASSTADNAEEESAFG